MPNEHTLEPSSSTTEPATTEPTTTETSLVDTSNPFRFLQTGAAPLDERLRTHRLPRGGVVHLDFAGSQHPSSFLLALAKSALNREERVVFFYVPSFYPSQGNDALIADLRAGRELDYEFAEALVTFSLASYFNAARPDDPAAPLRYLVAGTFDEFEEMIDSLLSEPAGAPDLVVVSGFERLFQHLPLVGSSKPDWEDEDEDEVERVLEASARLRRGLQIYSDRCAQSGTALFLSCSRFFYSAPDETLFSHGLRPLLHAHCSHTLFVEDMLFPPCERGACPRAVSGLVGVPVSLYERDILLARVLVPALEGAHDDSGMGPFLDSCSDPQRMAAFLKAIG